MRRSIRTAALGLGLTMIAAGADGRPAAVAGLLDEYRAAAQQAFSAERGRALWQGEQAAANGERRSCTSCHGADLTRPGRHVKTRKPIEAMAPSVNPQRLGDAQKVEKWFKRNCSWVLGRECTAQEKGDVLSYLEGL